MSHEEISKLLKINRNTDQLNFSDLWENGLFVFDANVLLDLYRLPQSASKDLMGVLKNPKFNERIWIGFQVALEFLNNRFEAISDQKNKFSVVRDLVINAIASYAEASNTLRTELSKLKLKQRHSVIDPDVYITSEKISASTSFLSEFLAQLENLDADQADVNDHDFIKDFVFEVFDGKIGTSFDQSTLDAVCKEGDIRYNAEIPPGFKDKKKEGFYAFDGKRYIRKFGDLILWKEIIAKASSEKWKYVVLVTGDVKDDWWSERRGKRLGPRKELLDEIYKDAPSVDTFHMYDTSSFLQYAKAHLDKSIKESSISEAKDLIALNRRERNVAAHGTVLIVDVISAAASIFPELRTGIGRSVEELPPMQVNFGVFYNAIMEIMANALHHCPDRYVSVQAAEMHGVIRLRFKNRKPVNTQRSKRASMIPISLLTERSVGLDHVRNILAREGIDVHISDTGNKFIVDIFLPKEPLEKISPIS